MASKKSFDREKMYRKIMPTYYDNDESGTQQDEKKSGLPVDLSDSIENETSEEINSSLFDNKEINQIKDRDEKVILYNITEKLVLEKLDKVLDSMNCCKCDRCKMDVIAMALNSLKPHYVVKTKDMIEDKKIDNETSQKVTSAVFKSVLAVRNKPRH